MELKEITETMNKLITLEDSTTDRVPQLLEEIVKRVTPQQTTDSIQKDYLFVVLIVSLIENGFVLVDNDYEIISHNSIDTNQLSKWKSQSGVYETLFVLYGFKTTSLKLIMSPLGAMVLVNVVIIDLASETYSTCLPLSRFVVSPQATRIPMIFRDLKQLSLTFKNNILSAAKSKVLNYYGYASASLIGLPEELFCKIMLKLQTRDVVNVSKTCLNLNLALQSNIFWHAMVKRDFAEQGNMSEAVDWKEIYAKSYIMKVNQFRAQSRPAGTLHDYMDYSDYVSYIDNPMWNVIM